MSGQLYGPHARWSSINLKNPTLLPSRNGFLLMFSRSHLRKSRRLVSRLKIRGNLTWKRCTDNFPKTQDQQRNKATSESKESDSKVVPSSELTQPPSAAERANQDNPASVARQGVWVGMGSPDHQGSGQSQLSQRPRFSAIRFCASFVDCVSHLYYQCNAHRFKLDSQSP